MVLNTAMFSVINLVWEQQMRRLGKYKQVFQASLLSLGLLTIMGCGSSSSMETSDSSSSPETSSNESVKVNQIAYLPTLPKIAIVPETNATQFTVHDAKSDAIVFSGTLSPASLWEPASQRVQVADFSAFSASGTYIVKVEGLSPSPVISIQQNGLLDLHDAALKAYYFNRASSKLTPEFAGSWARPMGHPDTQVEVHSSASSEARPEGTVISAPKGWYDAGDFNKYVVNSGISTYTLLAAFKHYPSFYQTRDGNIPESSNAIPDILDEIMWNIDWLAAMQDPNDGGVYHKLTTKNFAGAIMPHEGTKTRYVVQKGTAAALNFAGVMAMASRVFADIPEFAPRTNQYQQAAINAFEWALANPQIEYQQPSDIRTGTYDDEDFNGEFAWAAAELYLLTKQTKYFDYFNQYAGEPTTPDWPDAMTLGYLSLLSEGQAQLTTAQYNEILTAFLTLADASVAMHNASAYQTAMQANEFRWGSNSTAMNKALVAVFAHKLTSEQKYLNVAVGLTDYVLGKNPTDYSYVTGFGTKSPMDPHHRQSYADDVAEPIPGFLVGGPHTGRQDGCDYSGDQPATTYVDHWCSYATNEVTINWNAPLVYVLAALHQAQ